jgi:hypothetical protein
MVRLENMAGFHSKDELRRYRRGALSRMHRWPGIVGWKTAARRALPMDRPETGKRFPPLYRVYRTNFSAANHFI